MRVMRAGTLVVAAGVAAVLALPAAAGAQTSEEPRLVIRGDTSIAGFAVKTDGTLGGAVRALGAPSSVTRRSDGTCLVRWRPLGIRMTFYNLGGLNPCSRRHGHFARAVASGPRWTTARGLAIGDPRSRLRRLYPAARHRHSRFFGSGWWLVVRTSRVGTGGTYPGLLAHMRDRRVAALVVRFPAGGD